MTKIVQLVNNHFFTEEGKRLILFFIVGGINTLFAYLLYAGLLYIHFHYALASLLSTVIGVLFNFKTTGTIVFKNKDNRLLFRFIGVYCITYSVNVGCLRVFAAFDANMYLAGAVLTIPVALLAYTLMKRFVFGLNISEDRLAG